MFEQIFSARHPEYFDLVFKSAIKEYINDVITERLKKVKVQIPQKDIDDSIRDFFAAKPDFDIYEMIKEATLDAIGIKKNGQMSDEMIRVVQEEVANIIAKEGLNKINQNNEQIDSAENVDKISDQAYEDGVFDGIFEAVESVNKLLANYDDKIKINFNIENDEYELLVETPLDEDINKKLDENQKVATQNLKNIGKLNKYHFDNENDNIKFKKLDEPFYDSNECCKKRKPKKFRNN